VFTADQRVGLSCAEGLIARDGAGEELQSKCTGSPTSPSTKWGRCQRLGYAASRFAPRQSATVLDLDGKRALLTSGRSRQHLAQRRKLAGLSRLCPAPAR